MSEETKEQEKIVNIELDVSTLNIVLAALQELPHRVADPILSKIVAQAKEQLEG